MSRQQVLTAIVVAGGAVLTAFLTSLAAPPLSLWPAALVASFPLLLSCEARSWRLALISAWFQGMATNAVAFRWVARALHDHAETSWLASVVALIAFAALQGARVGVVAVLVRRLASRGWPLAAAFPLVLGAVEHVFPMLVPYTTGVLLVGAPSLVQVAELGGASLVAAWLGLLNAALYLGVGHSLRGRVRAARLAFAGAAILLLVTSIAGRIRIEMISMTSRAAPAVRIALVQPATPITSDDDPTDNLRAATAKLLAQAASPVDLVLWPETAIQIPPAYASGHERTAFFRDSVLRDSRTPSDAAARIDVPLLLGALIEARPSGGSNTPSRNAALLVLPTGNVTGEYIKRDLAPVGERAPFNEVPIVRDWFPARMRLTAGDDPAAIGYGSHHIGVSICIEDIISDRVRETVTKSQPDLLVNLSSDAWFGRSDAAELHLALASFRAIEHRRELIRLSHDGVTARIAATGIVEERLPRNQPAEAVWEAHWLTGSTAFDRYGAATWWVVVGVVAIACFVGPHRRAR